MHLLALVDEKITWNVYTGYITLYTLLQALELHEPQVQSNVESLYQTTNLLSKLLSLPNQQSNEYEQDVKQLCVDRWGLVKAKLKQVSKPTAVCV